MKDLNLVLVEPEIPQNTGNIARTCAVTGAALHLVRPMGFTPTDAKLRRAGLDYWNELDISYYDSLSDFLDQTRKEERYFFSAHACRAYTEVTYPARVFLVFGKESVGLPRALVEQERARALRLPMRPGLRCLNLSNAVAVAAYEVLRQWGFPGLG